MNFLITFLAVAVAITPILIADQIENPDLAKGAMLMIGYFYGKYTIA